MPLTQIKASGCECSCTRQELRRLADYPCRSCKFSHIGHHPAFPEPDIARKWLNRRSIHGLQYILYAFQWAVLCILCRLLLCPVAMSILGYYNITLMYIQANQLQRLWLIVYSDRCIVLPSASPSYFLMQYRQLLSSSSQVNPLPPKTNYMHFQMRTILFAGRPFMRRYWKYLRLKPTGYLICTVYFRENRYCRKKYLYFICACWEE